MNEIPKDNNKELFKPIKVSIEEHKKMCPSLYRDEEEMDGLLEAIDKGVKRRNLPKDKFESNEQS